MNASEIIEKLKTIPPNTKIVVRGYEDGYNDIIKLVPLKIELAKDPEWYYGVYFESESPEAIDACELFGENANKDSQ